MPNYSLMEKQFEIIRANRALILKVTKNLTIEQLNKIPEGFKNNIAWNMAHLAVTQQILCYKLSGLPALITEEMIEKYRKGTAPTEVITIEEFKAVKDQLITLVDTFEKDYKADIFQEYKPYPTSANVTLNNINEAFEFNNFHEGIHCGVILSLKKLV